MNGVCSCANTPSALRNVLSGMFGPMLQPPLQDAVVAVGTDCPQSRFIWLIHVIREQRTVVDRIASTAPSNLTVINKIKWSLNGEETVGFSGPTCTVSERMVFRRAVSALFLPRFCAMKTLKERWGEAPASCRADQSRKLHLSKVVNGAEMVQFLVRPDAIAAWENKNRFVSGPFSSGKVLAVRQYLGRVRQCRADYGPYCGKGRRLLRLVLPHLFWAGRILSLWLIRSGPPSPQPYPQRGHGSECKNVSFRVCSALARGENDESFRRLYRAPSPRGCGRSLGEESIP